MNKAFLDSDPLQTDPLIQPHQMRAFGVIVDVCTKGHLGPAGEPDGQCIKINNTEYGINFDG